MLSAAWRPLTLSPSVQSHPADAQRGTSICGAASDASGGGQLLHDVLVEAQPVFCGVNDEVSVETFADAHVEGAGVGPLREGGRDVLALLGHIGEHVANDDHQTLDGSVWVGASQDRDGNSRHVATNSSSSADQVTR